VHKEHGVEMQQRSEETRRKITRAALQRFSQYGYNAASVADICADAGISKGAFYHHFASKQALFLDLLEAWLAELDVQFTTAAHGASTISQGMIAMASLTGPVFEAADGRLPMFLEFWNQALRDPDVWKASIQPYHRYQKRFAERIEQGISNGELQPARSESVARALIGLALGMLLQAAFDPRAANWAEETRLGVQMIIQGLQRRKA
jgi:AcrR family transcriptional regulator